MGYWRVGACQSAIAVGIWQIDDAMIGIMVCVDEIILRYDIVDKYDEYNDYGHCNVNCDPIQIVRS